MISDTLFIVTAVLLLGTISALFLYYRRIRTLRQEYERAKGVVDDIVVSVDSQFRRQENIVNFVAQKIEGAATELIPELARENNPLYKLWQKAKSARLVEGVCKACATKMGTLEAAKDQGLTLLDEMTGHPSMARYRDDGFVIVSF